MAVAGLTTGAATTAAGSSRGEWQDERRRDDDRRRWDARRATDRLPPPPPPRFDGGRDRRATDRPTFDRRSTDRPPSDRRATDRPRPTLNPPAADAAYDADAADADRAWYDDDEGGAVDMGGATDWLPDESAVFTRRAATAARTARVTRSDGSLMSLAASHRASAARRDADAWEADRMAAAGVGTRGGAPTDDDDSERLVLLVHDARPPFLAGQAVAAKLAAPVLPVVDPTSDMATIARRGSALVRAARAARDAAKSRARFWEVAGSKMGAVTGLTEGEAAEGKAAAAEAEADAATTTTGTYRDALAPAVAQSDFAKSKTLAEQRAALPVARVRDDLLHIIREHAVVVVVGETGSGKTTQMAQYLAEDGYTRGGTAAIGCTQPRRVAAMSVAARVADEMGVPLGREVGYAIRFEDVTSPSTVIKFMTDGVLLRETLRDADLDAYGAIIMDEAHERSLNTDVLFGVLKRVVTRRRDFRLVVTSATLDSATFASFFGGAPVFTIPGRTFPVDTLYARAPQEDYVEAAVKQALAIHLAQPPGRHPGVCDGAGRD